MTDSLFLEDAAVDVDHSQDQQVSNGEVRLGRHYYPVLADSMTTLNLARFQNKTTFGDYSFDSDPLLSSEIFSSFTGGMGNETLKEGVDDDSFWEASLETRFPDGATLLPLSEGFGADGAFAAAFALGDFPASASKFYASFDNQIHSWNKTTREFEQEATLPNNPVALGVEFDGKFYIPMGGFGYATMDPSHVVVSDATVHIVHLLLWDRKLVALTTEGYVLVRNVGDASFPAPNPDLTLPPGSSPRKLVDFINQRGDPTVHITTNNRVYAYDPDGEVLYNTRLNYPKHPNQGLGAANFRGDTMFVSVGLGIHGYNGSLITSMGPDGRHGLPARHRGRIIDLYGEYNALLAMVEGVAAGALDPQDEEYVIQTQLYRDRDTYAISSFTFQPVFSSILRWSNSQWHKVWESPDASGVPSWMYVSEAQDEYRLWWGYGNQMYTQRLPIAFQNPKQYLRSGEQEFMPTGSLITGWFDADMTAFDKLALHMEVNLEDVTGFNDPGGRVTLQYQTNNDVSWRALGTADTVGRTILPFAYLPREVGNPFSRGRVFNKIRFRITYDQKTIEVEDEVTHEITTEFVKTTSPLMTSAIMKFIKIPESQLSWTMTIPLEEPSGYKGKGNRELASYLDYLLSSRELVEFGTNDRTYRVRAAQVQANKDTGYNEMGTYTVNLVEVRMGEDRPNTTIKFVDMAS